MRLLPVSVGCVSAMDDRTAAVNDGRQASYAERSADDLRLTALLCLSLGMSNASCRADPNSLSSYC